MPDLKPGNTPIPQPDLLGAALSHAYAKIPVFPCSPRTKQPLTKNGFKDATTDVEQVKAWWQKYPDALIGSPTGKVTDRLVIDTDSERAEEELRLLAEQFGGAWPTTFTVKTHDGKHFYFKYPGTGDVGNSSRGLPDHVDVRAEGGYVILPPSPHPAGGYYTVIDTTPSADVPIWLYKLLVDRSPDKPIEIREATPLFAWRQYHRVIAELRRAKPGNRNKRLNDAAWWAARLSGHPLLSEKVTSQEIVQIARTLGLSAKEIEDTCKSGWHGAQQRKIKILPIQESTDLGNSDRFVLAHGNIVRYVPAYGDKTGWHIWDGHRWSPDGRKKVRKLAQETVRAIHREAAGIEDEDIRKRIGRWALQSENTRRIAAMLECAQPHIAVEPRELDADLELLNLENGTLDLRTGEIHDQHPSNLITRTLPVSFEPSASCPLFEQHLKLVLPDDEVRDYFQEMIAYHFSGSTGEQCIHILHGDGENGKSTTVDLFRSLAGDYGWPAPRALFAGGYTDIAPHQIADLYGRRFVTCSEFKNGDVLRVEVMKALTGGESTELNGCRKYGHAFSFRPQAKFILDSNYLLEVDSPDFGTWRRIRLIAFNQTISSRVKKDAHFDKKLWAERSGILNWVLDGLDRWNARGRVLVVPRSIADASKRYEKEQDRLDQFISLHCVKDSKLSVPLRRFVRAFQDHRFDGPMRKKDQIGERAMEEQLQKRGYTVEYDERARTKMLRGVSILEIFDSALGPLSD